MKRLRVGGGLESVAKKNRKRGEGKTTKKKEAKQASYPVFAQMGRSGGGDVGGTSLKRKYQRGSREGGPSKLEKKRNRMMPQRSEGGQTVFAARGCL